MQAPRQPPAADELEAASAFVTGEPASSEAAAAEAPANGSSSRTEQVQHMERVNLLSHQSPD